MRNLVFILTAALLAVFVIQGCDKGHLADTTGPQPQLKTSNEIKSSRTQIYPFDGGVTLTFTGAAATDSLEWTVAPYANATIRQKGNVAVIIFGKVGSFVVTAKKVTGGASVSTTINVVSSIIPFISDGRTTLTNVTTSESDTLQYENITGDVKLGLGYSRNAAGDSVLINFSPYTANTFCSRGIMQYKSVLGNDRNFSLDLINIREPKGCVGATAPNVSVGVKDVFIKKYLGLGTHTLKITLNGVTYNGTVVITANQIIINWPYTTGITTDLHVINA